MPKGIDKSFRIQEPGLKALDGLRDYFTDTNRCEICAAALRFYYEKGGGIDRSTSILELPFDFCSEPIRSMLNESYKAGSTNTKLRIIIGKSEIEIAKNTTIKCTGLSSVIFSLANKTSVTLDLASAFNAELINENGEQIMTILT